MIFDNAIMTKRKVELMPLELSYSFLLERVGLVQLTEII